MDLHHWPLNLFRGKTSSPESGLPSPASGHIKGSPVMGLPAFVVLDRLSAADGGSLIPDGVGLLVQDEAVVDETTFDHKSVIVQAFYPVLLTVTSEFGIHLHPALAGAGDSWGHYILLSQVQPLCSTVSRAL